MIEFYKVVKDNIIDGFGTNGPDTVTAITEEEYDALTAMIAARPTAPSGYAYVIQDDPREWVLVELPPDDDPDLDEAELLNILLGGGVTWQSQK